MLEFGGNINQERKWKWAKGLGKERRTCERLWVGTKAEVDHGLPGVDRGGNETKLHLRTDPGAEGDLVQLLLHELIKYFQMATSSRKMYYGRHNVLR